MWAASILAFTLTGHSLWWRHGTWSFPGYLSFFSGAEQVLRFFVAPSVFGVTTLIEHNWKWVRFLCKRLLFHRVQQKQYVFSQWRIVALSAFPFDRKFPEPIREQHVLGQGNREGTKRIWDMHFGSWQLNPNTPLQIGGSCAGETSLILACYYMSWEMELEYGVSQFHSLSSDGMVLGCGGMMSWDFFTQDQTNHYGLSAFMHWPGCD